MDNEKLNILKLLVENQEQDYSIRRIALQRKVNYKSAYQAVQKLHREGLVKLTRYGNTVICRFNKTFNETVFAVEYYRLQELLHNKNFKVIYERLSAINNQHILLLFGSYAKNTATKHSDLDLLLVTNDQAEIQTKIELLPLPIHLTSITYADFQTMLKSKEFTVVSEAIKKNIILFGIEDYYRMVNNAG